MIEMDLEDRVRVGLHGLAAPHADPGRAVERASAEADRRRRRRMASLASAAVAALVLAVVGVTQLVPNAVHTAASPASGSILSWPTRGNLADDKSLAGQAIQVWRTSAAGEERPAQHITALYAGTVAGGATVTVLLSTRGDHALVGFVSSVMNLSGSPPPARHLVLRAVATVGTQERVRSVGFVTSASPADRPDDLAASLGYALLAPGISTGQVRSSMLDGAMSDNHQLPPASAGLVSFEGFAGSGPWNSWVVTPAGVTGVDVLTGGIGDPTYQPGEVDSAGVVRTRDGLQARPGDLVVARDDQPAGNGLLGVVTAARPGGGQLNGSLADLDRWGLQVVSVGTGYRGILSRDVNGGLIFTTDNPSAPDGVNRVVARTADGRVTVNIGWFAPDVPDNTRSPFPLQQSDTLPHTGSMPVWIIANGT